MPVQSTSPSRARRLTLITAALAAASALGLSALASDSPDATAAPPGGKPPNVIVVMTDDQTLESMRVMPAVERLAGQGTTFTSSFATNPLCCPSRATYFTGQYSHNHGVLTNSPPDGGYQAFDASNTLATWLDDAGYRTGYAGKYLNGYGKRKSTEVPPGFDRWYAGTAGETSMYDYEVNQNGDLVDYGSADDDYKTDVYADLAARFVKREAPGGAPFFLTFAPSAPHKEGGLDDTRNPRPAPRHAGAFADEELPDSPAFDEAEVSDKPNFVRRHDRVTDKQADRLEIRYQSRLESLLAVDEGVARIVRLLERAGELEDTVIVFTSDNGIQLGEHRLKLVKRVLYEESTRVPLVISGPGFPAGVQRDQLVGNIDLAPTIADIAGARPRLRQDGVSLLPLAADPAKRRGRDILFEGRLGADGAYSAIRDPRYVFAKHTTGEEELYDLEADPHQLESRHADPAFAAVRADLADRLAALDDCKGRSCR